LNGILIVKPGIPLEEVVTFVAKVLNILLSIRRVHIKKKAATIALFSVNIDIYDTFLFDKKSLVKTFRTVHSWKCNMSLASFESSIDRSNYER
jgi:hypothetical protein